MLSASAPPLARRRTMGNATQVGRLSASLSMSAPRGRCAPGLATAPTSPPGWERCSRPSLTLPPARRSTASLLPSLSATVSRHKTSPRSSAPSSPASLPRPTGSGSSPSTCSPWRVRTSGIARGRSGTCGCARRFRSATGSDGVHSRLQRGARRDRRPGLRGDSAQTSGIDYRAGRHRAWLKHKAEFTTRAELCAVRQDRDGRWHAICNIDGRRIHAVAGPRTAGRVGQRRAGLLARRRRRHPPRGACRACGASVATARSIKLSRRLEAMREG